jgi:FkbH-like protein
MKVTEALRINQAASKDASQFEVILACGFTPLHLQTFLGAYCQLALPERRVKISTGLYGNLIGTVEATADGPADATAIAIEWPDLDPRLGFRAAGRWGPRALPDILSNARVALERLTDAIGRIPNGVKIAVSMPTLPLPPLFHTVGCQTDEIECLLDQMVAEFRTKLAQAGISIVSAARLAEESEPAQRYDLKTDLLTGLPFTLSHADALAATFACLLCPPPPKKGIITDLDDTLWSGLAGEVGPDGVAWDLDTHQGLHAIYQRFLSALSEEGVLVAVASKNEPSVVEKTFQRPDIILRPERVFPIEANWNAKSASIRRILETWNIAADKVVYIDDSPMELAEVAAAHPAIECIQFPTNDYAACYAMLRRMRDLFGKERLSAEDSLRLDSIRQSQHFQKADGNSAPEVFLQQLDAKIIFDFNASAADPRAFGLVNKTNQFNLNGIRHTEANWAQELSKPNMHLITVGYEDRFGPLGKIGVIRALKEEDALLISVWVMSCRAFARRIEYQCIRACFERFQTQSIELDFVSTSANGPLRQFLDGLLGREPERSVILTRDRFDEVCPQLYHTVSGEGNPG